jgi:hypothetical protein
MAKCIFGVFKMKKGKVTICIGTIGSPTFKKCKNRIYNLFSDHPAVDKIVIIENKSPQSAWLNEMRMACSDTEWCLQVDEDMYLYPKSLDELISLYRRKSLGGTSILNASSLLYDLFLERKIGSLKLWNSEALQKLEFRDVLGGDRDYAKRAAELGYKNVETRLVLGDHDSAPTAAIAFSKYHEYIQKIKKFSGEKKAKDFVLFLEKKYKKNKKNYINKKAYDGAKNGFIKPVKNVSKRKLKNNNELNNSIDDIRKITSKKKSEDFLIATPIWKRPEVFKIFVKNNGKYANILAVGSEKQRSRLLAESLGCSYIESPNRPIGNKFNARIKYFLKNKQYSHIILLGSDDIICDVVFEKILKNAKKYDLISWKDIYYYDIINRHGVYSSGYNNHRKGEPLAPGRCLSRKLIESIGPNMWSPNVDRSPDANLWNNRLSKVKNQIVFSCKDIGGYIIDIKSDENLTPLKKIIGNSNKFPLTKKEIEDIENMIWG